LLAIERIVSEHPWATVSFFVLVVFAVFWVIRRMMVDEDTYPYKSGKEARLD
jgi:hypothetical protein